MSIRWKEALGSPGLRLGLFFAAVTGLRVAFAASVELCPDEAYYHAWSEKLDFGYHDHGPLVAWLVRLGVFLAGKNELGVRLGALFCSLVTAFCLYRATALLTDRRIAFWTALLATLTPLFSCGAVIHTPDAALAAAWSGAMLLALSALRTESSWAWAGCGACLGLGLLAKFSALLFPAGLLLFVFTCPAGRCQLRRSGFVLLLLVAGLLASPHLIWNAQQGGGSFAFQLRHALAGGGSWVNALAFLGGQAGALSPLLWLAAMAFLAVGWRAGVRRGRSEAYLLWCLGAPPLMGFFGLSFFSRVEANWPAVAYLPLAAAGAWAWSGGLFYPVRRRLLVVAAGLLALVLTLLAHVQALWAPLPISPKNDATRRLHGWRELARVASATADEHASGLAAQGYALVSELKFYSGREVFYLPAPDRLSQYDDWPTQPPPERSLLLLPAGEEKSPPCVGGRPLAVPEAKGASFSRLDDYLWWLCGTIFPQPVKRP